MGQRDALPLAANALGARKWGTVGPERLDRGGGRLLGQVPGPKCHGWERRVTLL